MHVKRDVGSRISNEEGYCFLSGSASIGQFEFTSFMLVPKVSLC